MQLHGQCINTFFGTFNYLKMKRSQTKSLRWDLDEMSVIGRSEPRPTLSSPPPALPVDSGAGGLSGEQGDDQLDLLQKVAAGFVATLLARSAAHLLRLEHEKGTNGRAKVSTDEVGHTRRAPTGRRRCQQTR